MSGPLTIWRPPLIPNPAERYRLAIHARHGEGCFVVWVIPPRVVNRR